MISNWFRETLGAPDRSAGENRRAMLWIHVAGCSVSIAIVFGIVLVIAPGKEPPTTVTVSGQTIDLQDAMQVVRDADGLRQQYAKVCLRAERVDQRADVIRQWLPDSVQWETFAEAVQVYEQQHDVIVEEIEQGKVSSGQRVGVVPAMLRVRGKLGDVCRFIRALTETKTPLACHQMLVEPVIDSQGLEERRSVCRVTLQLRLPFVGSATAAAKLLKKGSNDAG